MLTLVPYQYSKQYTVMSLLTSLYESSVGLCSSSSTDGYLRPLETTCPCVWQASPRDTSHAWRDPWKDMNYLSLDAPPTERGTRALPISKLLLPASRMAVVYRAAKESMVANVPSSVKNSAVRSPQLICPHHYGCKCRGSRNSKPCNCRPSAAYGEQGVPGLGCWSISFPFVLFCSAR